MSNIKPESLTIEEAVALILNHKLFLDGVSLDEILEAYIVTAEKDYDSATNDSQKRLLSYRVETCVNRYELAKTLRESLYLELKQIKQGIESDIALSQEDVGKTRIMTDSVIYWAGYHFGIEIPSQSVSSETGTKPGYDWEDLTVSLRAEHKIQLLYKGKVLETKFLHEMGLKGRSKSEPNHLYVILLGLALGKKYPSATTSESGSRTAITKLRNSLRALANIDTDPFQVFNKTDGYKPRFKLQDDKNAAAERAKEKAIHVTYDDNQDTNSYFADDN